MESGRLSIVPGRAVDDRALPAAALVVLALLCTYSDRQGWAWPAVATLAGRLGVQPRVIQKHTRLLADLGYLEIRHRRHPGAPSETNLYRVLYDADLPLFRDGRNAPALPEVEGVPLGHPGVSAQDAPRVSPQDTRNAPIRTGEREGAKAPEFPEGVDEATRALFPDHDHTEALAAFLDWARGNERPVNIASYRSYLRNPKSKRFKASTSPARSARTAPETAVERDTKLASFVARGAIPHYRLRHLGWIGTTNPTPRDLREWLTERGKQLPEWLQPATAEAK